MGQAAVLRRQRFTERNTAG